MNTGMDMKDMVAALARQPEDKRRMMMSDRLQMFLEMPDDKRKGAMKMMTEAVYALPDDDERKLIATRTALLAEMPEADRKKLMMTHMQVVKDYPDDQRMKEMQMVQESIAALPPDQRQSMMKMMQAMQSGKMPANGRPATAPPTTSRRPTATTSSTTTSDGNEGVRWITLVLGLWAVVAAFIFDAGSSVAVAVQVVAGLVAVFFPLINRGYWISALAGAALVIAPFVFGYTGIAQISSILTGLAIAALAAYKATR